MDLAVVEKVGEIINLLFQVLQDVLTAEVAAVELQELLLLQQQPQEMVDQESL